MPGSSLPAVEKKTVGPLLRQAREMQGLSLDDVARTTRISKGYLKALEDDDIDKLPSEAYAKGFLRVYLKFLNLEELQFEQLEHSPLHDQQAAGEGDSASIPCCAAPVPPARKFWKAALPFTLLLCIVLSTVLFCSSQQKPFIPETIKLTSNQVEEKTAANSGRDESRALTDEKAGSQLQTAKEPLLSGTAAVGEERFVLRLKAVEDGSLDLTVDEATTQHYDLKAGDLIEWQGKKSFSLDLDNAGGVEAELNGKPLKPFGDKGAAAHILLSAGYDGGNTDR